MKTIITTLLLLITTFSSYADLRRQDGADLPAGTIIMFSGVNCPAGFLSTNGNALLRTGYPKLYNAIGVIYGAGNGTTTFNLPNTQGVFIRGAGSQVISSITYTGIQGTTQGDQLQGHQHQLQTSSQGYNGVVSRGDGTSISTQATTSIVSDGTNGTPRTGSETRPANIVLNYCIKY